MYIQRSVININLLNNYIYTEKLINFKGKNDRILCEGNFRTVRKVEEKI
jgi:hypothetical protein